MDLVKEGLTRVRQIAKEVFPHARVIVHSGEEMWVSVFLTPAIEVVVENMEFSYEDGVCGGINIDGAEELLLARSTNSRHQYLETRFTGYGHLTMQLMSVRRIVRRNLRRIERTSA